MAPRPSVIRQPFSSGLRRTPQAGLGVGAALLALLLLSGCIQTISGRLPTPAPKDERTEAYLALARGHLNEGNLDRAAEPLERAVELSPDSVEVHVLLAVLSENRDEPELAEGYYRKALRLSPDDSQTLNNFGGYLLRQGRQDEALGYLRQAVEDPGYLRREVAYENLGVAELGAGNREAAKLAFARALGLEPDLARSNLELAAMEHETGDSKTALEFYDRYRANARQTPRSLCLGIQIASALGDRDRVSSYAIALRNLYPRSAEATECTIP